MKDKYWGKLANEHKYHWYDDFASPLMGYSARLCGIYDSRSDQITRARNQHPTSGDSRYCKTCMRRRNDTAR